MVVKIRYERNASGVELMLWAKHRDAQGRPEFRLTSQNDSPLRCSYNMSSTVLKFLEKVIQLKAQHIK